MPNHRAPIVTEMVFYKVGGADDPPGKSGAAHFLEHLMFRGTATVPPGEFSAEIARVGGEENAYTTDLEALKANLAARRAFYGRDFPAATWVQVSRLYQPDQVLEVELIAIFPPGTK